MCMDGWTKPNFPKASDVKNNSRLIGKERLDEQSSTRQYLAVIFSPKNDVRLRNRNVKEIGRAHV